MNVNQVNIRTALVEHISDVIKIDKEAFGSDSYSFFVFRQYLDCFQDLFKVAYYDQVIVGYIIGGVNFRNENSYVLSMAVLDAYKSMGIGGKLMMSLFSELESLGYRDVQLTVSPKNHVAIRFYLKLGFFEQGIESDYYGINEDRIILTKFLNIKK